MTKIINDLCLQKKSKESWSLKFETFVKCNPILNLELNIYQYILKIVILSILSLLIKRNKAKQSMGNSEIKIIKTKQNFSTSLEI